DATRLDLPRKLGDVVATYVATDGLLRLDRAQRLFEQANAETPQDDDVDSLVQLCRARYREVAGRTQTAFQAAVVAEGWPPEGMRRQTQAFDRYVAPEVAERRKVALILVDSLRYEMGRDLALALEAHGPVAVDGA